jgi:hypothetical protein
LISYFVSSFKTKKISSSSTFEEAFRLSRASERHALETRLVSLLIGEELGPILRFDRALPASAFTQNSLQSHLLSGDSSLLGILGEELRASYEENNSKTAYRSALAGLVFHLFGGVLKSRGTTPLQKMEALDLVVSLAAMGSENGGIRFLKRLADLVGAANDLEPFDFSTPLGDDAALVVNGFTADADVAQNLSIFMKTPGNEKTPVVIAVRNAEIDRFVDFESDGRVRVVPVDDLEGTVLTDKEILSLKLNELLAGASIDPAMLLQLRILDSIGSQIDWNTTGLPENIVSAIKFILSIINGVAFTAPLETKMKATTATRNFITAA